MKLLIDTHVLLWWQGEPERLEPKAHELLVDPSNEVFVSAATAWEIAIKYAIGKLKLPVEPQEFVPHQMRIQMLKGLAIEHGHALAAGALPPHHTDPFDRLLIAQAQSEGMSLVTADPKFRPYEIELVWAGTASPR